MADLLVRSARKNDQAALAALWGAMIAELRALDPRQPLPVPNAASIYAARLIDVLDDPKTIILVAQATGGLSGFALGALVDLHSDLFVPTNSGLIVDLFVDPAARRQGIGRALVNGLKAWFAAQGATTIELNVAAANEHGRAFWRSVGGSDYQIRMRIEIEGT